MNKVVRLAALSGALVAAGFGGAAQAATASASATAQILQPVSVVKNTDLNFAQIIPATSASTVAVSTGGVRTCGAALVCSGSVTVANFTATGQSGQTATVSVPGSVSLTSGSDTMSTTLVPSATSLSLAPTGSFTVGGTLSVGANQAAGTYTGSFSVTVEYQ